MFKLTLVTPEKTILKEAELAEVTLPAHSGELNILPGHASLMTVLKSGRLTYKLTNGDSADFVIAWGYCQVSDENVLVLAEHLKARNDLDISQITNSLKQMDQTMNEETLDDQQYSDLIKKIEELRSQDFFVTH